MEAADSWSAGWRTMMNNYIDHAVFVVNSQEGPLCLLASTSYRCSQYDVTDQALLTRTETD